MSERVILAIYSAGQLHNPVLGVILEYFGVICSGKEGQFILSKTFNALFIVVKDSLIPVTNHQYCMCNKFKDSVEHSFISYFKGCLSSFRLVRSFITLHDIRGFLNMIYNIL